MARIVTTTAVILDSGTHVALSQADLYAVGYMLGITTTYSPTPAVSAIRYLRLQNSGLGMKDAKDVVDCLRDNRTVFG